MSHRIIISGLHDIKATTVYGIPLLYVLGGLFLMGFIAGAVLL